MSKTARTNIFFLATTTFLLIIGSILLFYTNIKNNPSTKKMHLLTKKHINTTSIANNKTYNTNRKSNKKIELENFRDADNYEYGIWLWKSPLRLKNKESEQILFKIKRDKFNEVYITVDDFLLIKKINRNNYFNKLHNFITQAQKNNIKVDVVAGDKNWAKPEYRQKAYKFIDMVIEYNNKYPDARINKLQYDIEPYLLNEYKRNKKAVLVDFIEFIDIATNRLKRYPTVGFSVVLPHFYDSKQHWTPNILYKGQNMSTFKHIATLLERNDNSTIILMAYRNFFLGNNGVNAITQAEFKANKKYPKLIIAQETKQISPIYTTFYNYPQNKLFKQLDKIYNEYKKFQSFGGIAIHDFDGYYKLKQ